MHQYATDFSCFYLTSTESNEKIKGDISVLFFSWMGKGGLN
jgi:hypothetical protein